MNSAVGKKIRQNTAKRTTKKTIIECPHRLVRSRTPDFHSGDRGSNPLGDAIFIAGSV